jgi:predicted nucleic acid-binding protein
LATPTLFLEYEAVLKRSEQLAVSGLSTQDIDAFLAALASACEAVEVYFRWRPQLNDPADEMVLEAAVNGMADAMITFNLQHFAKAAGRSGLPVWLPRQLLQESPS